jgi:hypothetical protein
MADSPLTLEVQISAEQLDIHQRIWLLRNSNPEWARIKTYRDYCLGVQTVSLTEKQKKILNGLMGKSVCG